MKKVFRKHNASTLFDAFITHFISLYDGTRIYTWTGIEKKATLFDSDLDAEIALKELTEGYSNNYSYQYHII